jgi:hypothetical protein
VEAVEAVKMDKCALNSEIGFAPETWQRFPFSEELQQVSRTALEIGN